MATQQELDAIAEYKLQKRALEHIGYQISQMRATAQEIMGWLYQMDEGEIYMTLKDSVDQLITAHQLVDDARERLTLDDEWIPF